MFNTVEELEEAIDGYFRGGIKIKTVVVGQGSTKRAIQVPLPTITGLVNFIGFANRASFYDLEKDERFSHTIKRARSFIEQEYEELLQTGLGSGAIFALKNFGWIDRTETVLSGNFEETRQKMKGFLDEPDDSGTESGISDDGETAD